MLGQNQRQILYNMSTGVFDARGLRLVSNVTNPTMVVKKLVERGFIKEIKIEHYLLYKRTSTGRAALNRETSWYPLENIYNDS